MKTMHISKKAGARLLRARFSERVEFGDYIRVVSKPGCGVPNTIIKALHTDITGSERCSMCVFRNEKGQDVCICEDKVGWFPCNMPQALHLRHVYFVDINAALEEL